MKKLLLTLGSLSAIVVPVTSVVACSSAGETDGSKNLSEYKTKVMESLKQLTSIKDDIKKFMEQITKATTKDEVTGILKDAQKKDEDLKNAQKAAAQLAKDNTPIDTNDLRSLIHLAINDLYALRTASTVLATSNLIGPEINTKLTGYINQFHDALFPVSSPKTPLTEDEFNQLVAKIKDFIKSVPRLTAFTAAFKILK